jgi:hypothetical protein
MHGFFEPAFMPCSDCGASVARSGRERHACEDERLLDFRLFQLRDEVGAFDEHLSRYLASPAGRFAAFLAERDRFR